MHSTCSSSMGATHRLCTDATERGPATEVTRDTSVAISASPPGVPRRGECRSLCAEAATAASPQCPRCSRGFRLSLHVGRLEALCAEPSA